MVRLIIIDGLDGTGKDTQALLMKKRYEALGQSVVIRSHPSSDNYYGRSSKRALLSRGRVNRLKASVFYMMDVIYSLRKYWRHPKSDVLIMVRYLMGTAYLPRRLAPTGYHFFEKFVPTSPYMFFLDASPQELVARIKQRTSEQEMFETLEALEKVRSKALPLAKGWYIIDTSKSLEDTAREIAGILDTLDKRSSAS
jgi:dTMP kinase